MSFKVGDTVSIRGQNRVFEIIDGPSSKGEFKLAHGSVSLTVSEQALIQATPQKNPKHTQQTVGSIKYLNNRGDTSCSTITIDLHGMTVCEASAVITSTLDRAILTDAAQIDFIHGLGTGAIKKALHKILSESTHVRSFKLNPYNHGTTIAYL